MFRVVDVNGDERKHLYVNAEQLNAVIGQLKCLCNSASSFYFLASFRAQFLPILNSLHPPISDLII